ncbi:hypothetical protein GYMLUDRAFT_43791 [Collybiopsis luxurians FD-317 M1]|uniref:Uncharacterized protein n=1 Tax=Collybiopsis luxurians FD-317 M1 TaxID=944289 RepID=A0A0D0BXP8_9AGAR|nr:hypothetical protein GYMLUDRAFT_43791 [Collybiopsis luxurians FD-317 M1]
MSYEKDLDAPLPPYDGSRPGMQRPKTVPGQGAGGTVNGAFFAGAHSFDINGGEFNHAARDIHKTVNNDHSTKSNFDNDYKGANFGNGPNFNDSKFGNGTVFGSGASVHNGDVRNDNRSDDYWSTRNESNRRADDYDPRYGRSRRNFGYEQRARGSFQHYNDFDEYSARSNDLDDFEREPSRSRRDPNFERYRAPEYSSEYRRPAAPDTFSAGGYRNERQRQGYLRTEKERLVSAFIEWLDCNEDMLLGQKKLDSQIFKGFMNEQEQNGPATSKPSNPFRTSTPKPGERDQNDSRPAGSRAELDPKA